MEQFNFSDIFSAKDLALSVNTNLSISLMAFNIFYAGVIGFLIAFVYRKFYMGVLFQKSFAVSIIGATIITTLVIMVISGNLILSLGMVGALSIVRFRSAIKDPLDIIYLFWGVGSGIAIGVSQYSLVLIGLLMITLVFSVLTKFDVTQKPKLIVISAELGSGKFIQEYVAEFGKKMVQRSSVMTDGKVELVFETSTNLDTQTLMEKLLEFDKNVELRILNYYGNN